MPSIDSVRICGFKSIRDVDVPLRPINVLIGANGSGKSNFIGAFQFLQRIRAGMLNDYTMKSGGADTILHFGSKQTGEVSIKVWFAGEESRFNGYEITLGATGQDSLYVSSEAISFWDKKKYESPYITWLAQHGPEAAISSLERIPDSRWGKHRVDRGIAHHVAHDLDGFRLYHFHDTGFYSPMKKTTEVRLDRYLHPDGSNLAAFLYRLREEHEISYDQIRRTVWLAAPFFQDFVLSPRGQDDRFIRLEWQHVGSETPWDVSSLSDGTLRFIALTTLLLQPEELRPSVILLDEPEIGLHPYAITLLAAMVQESAAMTQVILTTQSPRMVNYFEPEDVLVADRIDGATDFTRLSKNDLKAWLKDYTLGDLWQMNEFGGNRARETVA